MNLIPLNHLVDSSTVLFWFRRDLRIEDNAALHHALKENEKVLPLFIFDTEILDKLEDKTDARVDFIHQSLKHIKDELEIEGSSLLILQGNPIELFSQLTPKSVYTNHDYEPYGKKRDILVASLLKEKGSLLKTFKDQVIFEKEEIMKEDGTPYTVFTPYSKKWKGKADDFFLKSYGVKKYKASFIKITPLPFPALNELGFQKTGMAFPPRLIKKKIIEQYQENRNFPAKESTSRLSIHLRFGTVSIRSLARIAYKTSETWLNELIWREFYHMILWQFPRVEKESFKPQYDKIEWKNNEDDFNAWCEGKTGYPIVDAGMRELNTTGFMHNRVRMIAASFLTKHLLIDWRMGETYFAKKLLDFDLAANNGGWQWAAGSGCDATPYFRVFNPYLQAEKFDPNNEYISNWVKEINTPNYPKPIINHQLARARVLEAYKLALTDSH